MKPFVKIKLYQIEWMSVKTPHRLLVRVPRTPIWEPLLYIPVILYACFCRSSYIWECAFIFCPPLLFPGVPWPVWSPATVVSLSSVLPLPPLANHTPAPPSQGSICSAGVKGSSDLKPTDIFLLRLCLVPSERGCFYSYTYTRIWSDLTILVDQ